VRVIAPFVGGGFGPKIMLFYPEEVVLPWAAMRLQRPVKWIEDRREHFFATTHERGQIHDAEMALSRNGRILGIKDVFLHDSGVKRRRFDVIGKCPSCSKLRVFAGIVASVPIVGVCCTPARCLLAPSFVTVRIVRHVHGSRRSAVANS
jgi:hypothetical protein